MKGDIWIFLVGTCLLSKYMCSHVFSWQKNKASSCSLITSHDGKDAGVARAIKTECRYNNVTKKYFYKISWQSPQKPSTNVTAYVVVIHYDTQICFQLSKNVNHLQFNDSVGFQKGRRMRYAVIPQPIVRIGGRFSVVLKDSPWCPLKLKLKSLPNVVIPLGSNYTFKCTFEENPVEDVSINWYFTPDLISCTKDRQKLKSNDYINISADKRVLEIILVTRELLGCYVVIASDGTGRIHEEKGYIRSEANLRLVSTAERNARGSMEPLSVIILIVIATLIVLSTLAIILFVRCKPRRSYLLPRINADLSTKVYLSYSAENQNEITHVQKFTQIIRSFNIDLIADFCNDLAINSEGGISRWVSNNIKVADVIMIVLTPSYLNSLKSYDNENNNVDINECKVHLEYYLVNNLFFNSLRSKELIIISKDVEPDEFPSIFQNRLCFQFPSYLGINCVEDLDDNFRNIINFLSKGNQPQFSEEMETLEYQML